MDSGRSIPVTAAPGYSLWQLVRYMLRLGSLGFGGPVALAEARRSAPQRGRRWLAALQALRG